VIGELLGLESTTLPHLDERAFARACAFVVAALERGAIASAHLVGDGGVLAAIAKMAFVSDRGLGFRVDPRPMLRDLDHDAAWFSEIPAFVLEVVDPAAFAELGARMDVASYDAGEVLAEPVAAIGDERISIAELREAWEAPLRGFYEDVA
jgi:phosphoribosylformylglycinamidine (FGAM) synthase-like enzyme